MSLEPAIDAVRSGKVIGLPTDTVYGLGIDPTNDAAVARLFEMKGRPVGKPVGLLVASIEQADSVGEIKGVARDMAASFWPGALTLIVVPKIILSDWVGDTQRRTIGIRVPDLSITRDLLQETGPLAVTSANRSGEPEAISDTDARRVFGDEVAWYVDGTSPGGVASTVVDATSDPPVVLREGAVRLG